jgi:hypothetical protein
VATSSLPHLLSGVRSSSRRRCRRSAVLKTGQRNSVCLASIHSRLVEMYDPDIMSTQMVRRWCQQFRDGRTSMLDDARPHTAAATVNHIATFGCPYSPDLAPSDFHFFPALKRTLEGRRFTTNEDVEAAVRTQDTDFYQREFFKLVKRWDKCISVGGDYVEKYPTNAPFRPHRYLVHAVSCRWRTRETYFPTIPYIHRHNIGMQIYHQTHQQRQTNG